MWHTSRGCDACRLSSRTYADYATAARRAIRAPGRAEAAGSRGPRTRGPAAWGRGQPPDVSVSAPSVRTAQL